MMSRIVAIVGRPNVGKSTLFNRLTKSKTAIVEEQSGVTRDRIYGLSEWNGTGFSVIDTGGYVNGSEDVFEAAIRQQVEIAIEEAAVILFVVDVTVGITDLDQSVARLLRRAQKPVYLCVNKVDNHSRQLDAAEFYQFGFDHLYPVSAVNGSGTGELLDQLTAEFAANETNEEEADLPRIAVVGKPNVGKSSFINAITGEERTIVTAIPGTTRDAIDSHYRLFGFDFKLIDTAGIRKKKNVHEDLEFYSVIRSVRSIERADVCILMIDATEGMQKQDLTIFYTIEKNKKGVVILVNKWDLIAKDSASVREFTTTILSRLAPFNDVPIIFTSTISKQRLHKALETALHVYKNRTKRIPTSQLNQVVKAIVEKNPPPSVKGKSIAIKYATMLPTHAPSFAFFCNLPQYIQPPYKRYMENRIREQFDFKGIPMRLFFRKK